MPITLSAKKALRRDKRRTVLNARLEKKLKEAIGKARKTPSKKIIASTISIVDRAAKVKLIHKNKAGRIKSRLAKLLK